MSDNHVELHLKNAEARYGDNVAKVARALRDLADRVEREGALRDEHDVMGTPAGAWSAHHIVHAVTWGVANLNLAHLINGAAEVDGLRREMETTP